MIRCHESFFMIQYIITKKKLFSLSISGKVTTFTYEYCIYKIYSLQVITR